MTLRDEAKGEQSPMNAPTMEQAWHTATAALGPRQRLVLWQDHDGPCYVQVLEPSPPECDHEDEDSMKPVLAELAAYPSKGLGSIPEGLASITKRLDSHLSAASERETPDV